MEDNNIRRTTQIRRKFTAVVNETWKQRWLNTPVNAWTRRILSTPEYFIQAKIIPDFWTSQALSGHGVFQEFLYKINRKRDPECCCGTNAIQSPMHVFQECEITRPHVEIPDPTKPDSLQKWLHNARRIVKLLWALENPLAEKITQ